MCHAKIHIFVDYDPQIIVEMMISTSIETNVLESCVVMRTFAEKCNTVFCNSARYNIEETHSDVLYPTEFEQC